MVPVLDGRHWRLLPLVVVRSTGFPVELVQALRLSAPEELLAAEAELEAATAQARAELTEAGDGKWRKQAGRKLSEQLPFDPPSDGAGREVIARYNGALEARGRARAAAAGRFEDELFTSRKQLLAGANSDDFREVLFASSETASAMLQRLLERPLERQANSKQRGDEDRISLFLQRLTAKNETASFYGPLFWSRIADPASRFTFEPGPGHWLSQREVFVEHWATSAIALAIAADADVAPFLPPSFNPSCRLEGRTLHYPVGKRAELSEAQARAITLADGTRTLAELRAADAEAVDTLLQKRILQLRLLVPTVLRCDEWLRERVAALPEHCAGRQRWLDRLDELRRLRDEYRASPLAGRRQVRAAVDERFREWTANDPRRGQGRMFVGRNVLHEICGRNVTRLDLGPLAAEIEAGMAPLCEIARWAFLQEATAYERRFAEALAPRLAQGPLDLLEAIRTCRQVESTSEIEEDSQATLLTAWRAVAGERWDQETREIDLAPEQVAEVARRLPRHDENALGASELVGADFHSPDLLFAANGPDAIARGDYRVVVGELHSAVYSVSSPSYLPFCAWPDQVKAEAARLLPDPFLTLVDPPDTYNYGDLLWPDVPALHEVAWEGTTSRFGRGREIPIGEVQLERAGDRLYIRTVDGRFRQRLLSLYQSFLHRKLFALPLVPYAGTRGARVTAGKLVLRRRTWRFTAADRPPVDFSAVRTLDGWVALRRWQRRHDLPDLVFSKVTGEPKPVMVDFASPLLTATWLRMLDEERSFWCAEMMPAPSEMWLIDGRGRFSSELRFTVSCR